MTDNDKEVRQSEVSLSELAKDGERLKSVGLYHRRCIVSPEQVFEKYANFYKLLKDVPVSF